MLQGRVRRDGTTEGRPETTEKGTGTIGKERRKNEEQKRGPKEEESEGGQVQRGRER